MKAPRIAKWIVVAVGVFLIALSAEELLRTYVVCPVEKHTYVLPLAGVCDILATCLILAGIGTILVCTVLARGILNIGRESE